MTDLDQIHQLVGSWKESFFAGHDLTADEEDYEALVSLLTEVERLRLCQQQLARENQEQAIKIHRLKPDVYAKDEALRNANARIRDLVAKATERNALIEQQAAAIKVLRASLEIISGKRQCMDNLMSNSDIAQEALKQTEEL